MKVAIICYPTHGGSGVVASELAIGLAKKGHKIHIVSYATPFRLRSFHQNILIHEVGITTYPLFKYPPYALGLATKLVELVETHGLELIHAHYAIPHAASAWLAKQILSPQGIKIITTLHGTDITLVGTDRSFHRVVKFTIEHSDGVTTVSNYLKECTVREFGIRRDIRVIPNFIDPERPDKNRGLCERESYAPHGEKILMHASNFRPVKRVGDVVRIFAQVRSTIPAKLLLVGDGPERPSIQLLVKELQLGGDVFFLSEQDHLEPLFFCTDLFLLPSEQESFGLTALEAMNCGVPVIATQTGGLPEVITHGETGYLFPVGQIKEMAEQAVALLNDPEQHEQFKRQAKRHAAKSFNADQIIPQYEAYYEEILRAPLKT
ncbi:MAG: N-acetyl-alpha-D-glucosaminyl L-malate synthase BshA [Acidobacteria bacterium]|nr:N-acetyl-alpha-D-glucosaminyl L-malate synthase BshA [Acidobacteriota bacterium]MCG2815424.1 N-acetyl-alpha-D-glucosaminyl L-malate synthase BshA [Candidatus Aminicenantes bacterium]MBU1474188.1 N-acetyl-alpha-D-glucosaminyl L-malate synthase BshA [Acidobacteriota bacterium]MBU4203617.1 N-acetyl-alpha-D-glucosaminyl L-malate synthase BshA [Acidobacteriota bacterium]MBU4254284.1 N-acetyl-alpha-D-glucosaminyl L-malate synthase BshA [Acidobacteriota bacterium]